MTAPPRNRRQEILVAMVCVIPGMLLNYLASVYSLEALHFAGVPADRAALFVGTPLAILFVALGRRAWRAARALRPSTPLRPTLVTGFWTSFVIGSAMSLGLVALATLGDHVVQAAARAQ